MDLQGASHAVFGGVRPLGRTPFSYQRGGASIEPPHVLGARMPSLRMGALCVRLDRLLVDDDHSSHSPMPTILAPPMLRLPGFHLGAEPFSIDRWSP